MNSVEVVDTKKKDDLNIVRKEIENRSDESEKPVKFRVWNSFPQDLISNNREIFNTKNLC